MSDRTAQEHADVVRQTFQHALTAQIMADLTKLHEFTDAHDSALDALLSLLAEAERERDEAQSAAIRCARLLRDTSPRRTRRSPTSPTAGKETGDE